MLRTLLASLMGVVLFAGTAQAAEGPFMVRVRGVYILPANGSDAIGVADLAVPKDGVHVSDKLIPEIDFSYFFTPNLAAELILTYPQEHDVTVHGATLGGAAVPNGTKIGTATHLPPVLSLQWHFLPDFVVNPYVGAGVNLTLFTSTDLTAPVTATQTAKLELDSASIGFAAQVGADIKIAEHIYANLDAKWVMIGSDVKAGGAKISHVSINPFLLAAGLGYRF